MSNIYFISGHRDLTIEEFNFYYKPKILNALEEINVLFVIGDCIGADQMAQEFLYSISQDNVIVFHMFDAPRINYGFKTSGHYKSDIDRDTAMTLKSTYDIAWIRKGRSKSGTAQNLKRRIKLNEKFNGFQL